jgi:hypothetical protein
LNRLRLNILTQKFRDAQPGVYSIICQRQVSGSKRILLSYHRRMTKVSAWMPKPICTDCVDAFGARRQLHTTRLSDPTRASKVVISRVITRLDKRTSQTSAIQDLQAASSEEYNRMAVLQ